MTLHKQILDVINTLFLGIGLPSADVGTDINLGVALIINGHPRWAMWVLAPVFMNMFFTFLRVQDLKEKIGGSMYH